MLGWFSRETIRPHGCECKSDFATRFFSCVVSVWQMDQNLFSLFCPTFRSVSGSLFPRKLEGQEAISFSKDFCCCCADAPTGASLPFAISRAASKGLSREMNLLRKFMSDINILCRVGWACRLRWSRRNGDARRSFPQKDVRARCTPLLRKAKVEETRRQRWNLFFCAIFLFFSRHRAGLMAFPTFRYRVRYMDQKYIYVLHLLRLLCDTSRRKGSETHVATYMLHQT